MIVNEYGSDSQSGLFRIPLPQGNGLRVMQSEVVTCNTASTKFLIHIYFEFITKNYIKN